MNIKYPIVPQNGKIKILKLELNQKFSKKLAGIVGQYLVFEELIRKFNEENNENRVPFIGKFTIKDNPEFVANDILTTLNINPLNYKSNNPIIEWIDKYKKNKDWIDWCTV